MILEIAAANSIPFREANISAEALKSASEIWVASSTREIVPIIECDGVAVGNAKPGPVWEQFDNLFQAYKLSLA